MPLRDRPPRGISARLFRLPITLYRLKLGWLLGSRFMLMRHRGRRSGLVRSTVIEVIGRDHDGGAYYAAAAWGEHAQWYRNIVACPDVTVTVGRATFAGMAAVLAPEDGRRILEEYRRQHRWATQALLRFLGYESFDDAAEALPVVAIRRAGG